jgi:hypothetical protein
MKERKTRMTAEEALKISKSVNLLQICLDNVYTEIEKSAKLGNTSIIYDDIPINFGYEYWFGQKIPTTLRDAFLEQLKKDGYELKYSDTMPARHTLKIDWNKKQS